MGDGTRLAIAILILFLAGVAFFFAFHPNGVANASNPDNALEWLFTAFSTTSGDISNVPAGDAGGTGGTSGAQPGETPAPQQETAAEGPNG
jgi:hypothetical protein